MSLTHTEEFNVIAKAQKERALQQDRDDYNNELHGNVTGRIQRFLSREAFEDNQSTHSGKKASTAKLSALDILLLNDPEYAKVHKAALDENRATQAKVTDLQNQIDRVMAKLDKKIADTLDQAITLPDGRKIFMNKAGEVYSTDGELIDPAIVEGYDWNDRPPLEHYLSLTQNRTELIEISDEADTISLRNGERREKLEDSHDPLDHEEIQELRDEEKSDMGRLEQLNNRTKSIDTAISNASTTHEKAPDQEIAVSKLNLF
ncbi:hypothetical protein [Pseudovibrio exalbescens]|uniref:Uncharacterized protein n=1 Tax=Pseudovibrio exalbescens TaxID=197461 RepID=A0A1U7JE47_9HYPH|nr:hypothetical protein [Pseudovibrio exalbescens]OKL42921.1 hypothetical protein A3843_16315 [Pseudovibrio exalbescens]